MSSHPPYVSPGYAHFPKRVAEATTVLDAAHEAKVLCKQKPCTTGWLPDRGGTHKDAHLIVAIMDYAERRARVGDSDEEVTPDPWAEVCERHAEEMAKHPRSFFALHPEHGIVARASTYGKDLRVKLDALDPKVRDNVLLVSGATFVRRGAPRAQ